MIGAEIESRAGFVYRMFAEPIDLGPASKAKTFVRIFKIRLRLHDPEGFVDVLAEFLGANDRNPEFAHAATDAILPVDAIDVAFQDAVVVQ